MPLRKKVSPAEYVIQKFGGVRALSRRTGIHYSCISRWRNSETGHIPNRMRNDEMTYQTLLRCAKKDGLALTEKEIVNGGYV